MDTTLIEPLITWAGAAGVFCVLFVTGLIYPRSVVSDLKAENAELKADRDAQRQRADTAVAASTATRDIIAALREGLEMGRRGELPAPSERERAGP